MKLYGIKTCGSVKKAIAYCKTNSIDFEFIDFKQTPPDLALLEHWLTQASMTKLFNTKGTKYRTLKLKDLNLDDAGKKEWLLKEPLLIKRPVLETDSGEILVGFDESEYDAKLKA